MGVLEPIILVLAVTRITLLFSAERGPFGLFSWLREKSGTSYTDVQRATVGPYDVLIEIETSDGGTEAVYAQPHSELSRLLHCHKCLSLWVGAICTLLYVWNPTAAIWLLLPFAASLVSILMMKFVE